MAMALTGEGKPMRIGSLPGIRRLPMYLDILRRFQREGQTTTSSPAIADAAGVVVSVVRKDIEMTGASGKTGVGFSIERLIADIEAFLGWSNPHDAFLAGAGHLGSALLGYSEFHRHGLNIVAAFDVDPNKIGIRVHNIEVLPMNKMVPLARRMHIGIGVIAVPSHSAQQVADLMVEAGITRIWSFAAPILAVPAGVTVQREDLSAGLAELLVRSSGRFTVRDIS